MNKTELIAAIANATGETQTAAAKHLDAFIDIVGAQLGKGDDVTVTGFGKFSASKRPARVGRNPRTGESVNIPASTSVKFAAGSKLKLAVNG